jgi:ubiquinone/menaquinone biosynthesis C-methylase UbiE
MKRVAIAELLDTDSGTPAEIAGSLADLRWFNQRFGGIGTAESMIRCVAAKLGVPCLSLLEVAAGSGYVPVTARQHLQSDGLRLEITLLDRAPSHLTSANWNGGNRAVVGDALALPFPDSSFDLVSSTLFAHHLGPADIVQFVDEGLRVCRGAVLINDLVRHPLHLAIAYLGSPLYRSRITRHDAPASVRQAYTEGEMRALLAQTKAARVEITRRYLFRMGVIAWKR